VEGHPQFFKIPISSLFSCAVRIWRGGSRPQAADGGAGGLSATGHEEKG